ncbi:hypothetical protein KIM372_13270 [Bombiscardovia nodaiensis]|uniref:RCC1-like domain-containing protein n=1 Tax=Bombiscardovia nodaiensis TaxID=2932181 RepID=A0ABM8B943_9BIFI|nr:hypothetical protein KIM372_13270 [Bombiscardovia nodaiensis]
MPQAHADPITDAQGFSLNPTYGPADGGNDVAITPPFQTTLTFKRLIGGSIHTLGVTDDNTLWAWGFNSYGQLGNGTTSTSNVLPIKVKVPDGVQFRTDPDSLAVGLWHNLAIDTNGSLWAWGFNDRGMLGDGTTIDRSVPIQVQAPAGVKFKQVSASAYHSLALDTDGNVWAWGDNSYSRLGDGTATYRFTPVKITAPVPFTTVQAGQYHSMALDQDGNTWAWGKNTSDRNVVTGVLGTGDTTSATIPTPRKVLAPCHFKTISTTRGNAGFVFTLGISKETGDLYAWGDNQNGQLGDNTTITRTSPTLINTSTKFTTISAGAAHVLAVDTNHTAWAWGANNSTAGLIGFASIPGVLGDGTLIDKHTPVRVHTPTGVVGTDFKVDSVNAGFAMSTAIGSDGKAYAWGPNSYGQLGDGTTTNRPTPVQVAKPKIVITGITFDATNVVGFTHDNTTDLWHVKAPAHPVGKVKVRVKWTLNGTAQIDALLDYEYRTSYMVHFDLGQARGHTPLVPDQAVVSGEPIKWPDPMPTWANHWFDGWFKTDGNPWDFSKPVTASMTLTAKWEAYQFTLNPNSGSTNGHAKTVVTAPDPPKGIRYTQVTAGWYHSVAIGSDGNTYAWGHNQYGQLGTDDTTGTNQSQPVRVHTPTGVHFISVDAGYWHTFATGSDGKLYAWGFNGDGRLGVGGVASQLKPAPVKTDNLPAGTRLVTASAGGYHSLGIDSNGQLYTWGGNDKGELGTNDLTGRLIPTPVTTNIPTGTRFKQVSAGFQYSEALDTNGHLYAWGENANGQLGVNDYTQRNIPTPVITDNITPGTQIAQVSSGAYHTLATDTNGRPYAWGNNNNGQLSITGITQAPKPTPINTTGITPNVRIESVKAGAYYSMALDNNGRAYTWGYNDYGQLGSNDLTQHNLATAINTDNITVNTRIIQITGNYYHSLAINNQYTTYAWGANSNGQIGNGTTTQQLKATPVGLQRLTVTGVKFDNIPAPTGPTLANGTSNKWNTTTPPHPTGDVDTTIEWTLGNYPQTNYTLTYTYWFDLPAAGTIPLQRYSGSTIFTLTAITAVTLTGHQLSKARKRKAGRHSLRPNQTNSRN